MSRIAAGTPVRAALIGLIGVVGLVGVGVLGGCSTDDEAAPWPAVEDRSDEQRIEEHEAVVSQLDAAASFAVTIRNGVPTVLTLDCERVLSELWLQTIGFEIEAEPSSTGGEGPRKRVENPRIALPLESSTMEDGVRMFTLTDDQWTAVQAGLTARPGVESPYLAVGFAFNGNVSGSRSTLDADWPTFPLVRNLAAEDDLDPPADQSVPEFRDSCGE